MAGGPLGSPFIIQPPPVLTENQLPLTPEFDVTQIPETFSRQPDVQIPVTQEDRENTENPNYNSDTTAAIPGQVTTAESETNEDIAEADEVTEHARNPRQSERSETSDGEFFTSHDIIRAVSAMSSQVAGVTEAVTGLQTQNEQQTAIIFELRPEVQQLTEKLNKKPLAAPTPQP